MSDDIKVQIGLCTEDVMQSIADYEAMMSPDGKAAYAASARALLQELGVDVAKLAILLLAHPQVTEKLASKVN